MSNLAKTVPRLYEGLSDDTPGSWWRPYTDDVVQIMCPDNHLGHVRPNSVVMMTPGRATISYRCPGDDCGFERYLCLEDWRGHEPAIRPGGRRHDGA